MGCICILQYHRHRQWRIKDPARAIGGGGQMGRRGASGVVEQAQSPISLPCYHVAAHRENTGKIKHSNTRYEPVYLKVKHSNTRPERCMKRK